MGEPDQRPVILIVDDAPESLAALSRLLTPHYRVRAAGSGERALQVAARPPRPDLMLLDVIMPGLDGFEVLRRLRATAEGAELPVILLTASSEQLDEERGFAAGAVDYIHKPAVEAVVLARVRSQLEARAARDLLRITNRQLAVEVAQGAHALEEAQRQLLQAEKLAAMGMLAAGVAHEVNTPISAVRLNLEALGEQVAGLRKVLAAYQAAEAQLGGEPFAAARAAADEVDLPWILEEGPPTLAHAHEAIERVQTIVRDLKGFSRSDDDDWQWTDLHQVLDSMLNLATSELKYHCTVVRRYGEVPLVRCLPSRIGQVFLNLIVNAAQAIEGRGELTLTTAPASADSVQVEVRDTGKGIPPEVLPRIFEPFFTTKPAGTGTGLGLPTVQKIVARHGGRITVESRAGEGTRFTVTLPCAGRQ